jgi:hypothetical protein
MNTEDQIRSLQSAADADERKPEPQLSWGAPELISPQILSAKDSEGRPTFELAANGNDFLLHFNSLGVELSGPTTEELHATKVAAFHIPLTIRDASELSGFIQSVVYGAITSPGARAVLFVDVGGVANVIEFPYGKPSNGEVQRLDIASRITSKTLPAIVPLTVTFTLLIQRLTKNDNAILQVDGLDIHAVFGPFDAFVSKRKETKSRCHRALENQPLMGASEPATPCG